MPASTTSIRSMPSSLKKSPTVAAPSLAINPRGSRELGQTVSHAPRLRAMHTRDYGKNADDGGGLGFAIPGMGYGKYEI